LAGERTLLLVEVAAMGDLEDDNFTRAIIHLVTHAPISHADSPDSFLAFYFQTSGRTGIRGERQDGGNDPILDWAVEALKVALSAHAMLTLNINLVRGA